MSHLKENDANERLISDRENAVSIHRYTLKLKCFSIYV